MLNEVEQTSYYEKSKADYSEALTILQELKEQKLRGENKPSEAWEESLNSLKHITETRKLKKIKQNANK